MKFNTKQANDAYSELVQKGEDIIDLAEKEARSFPVDARVHLLIEISKMRLMIHAKAIEVAAGIDSAHAGIVVGAHAMLSHGG